MSLSPALSAFFTDVTFWANYAREQEAEAERQTSDAPLPSTPLVEAKQRRTKVTTKTRRPKAKSGEGALSTCAI